MNFIKSLKKILTLQNVLFILACLFTVNIICNNNINEGLQNNSDPGKTLFLVFIILIIIVIVLVASQNKLR